MKNFLIKIKAFIVAHKIISVIAVILIVLLGRFTYGKITSTAGETRYLEGKVEKGTIISSVDGSGQVSVSNQIDIKPKVSGNITYAAVKAGDKVWQGKALFSIDDRDAQKAVRDAETSLQSAQLDLQTYKAQSGNTEENQQIAVNNAYQAFLNSTITALPTDSTSTATPPTISGTYSEGKEGQITITTYQGGTGAYFNFSGPGVNDSGSGNVSATTAQPIGDSGLYIKFANTGVSSTNWIINIPNKSASNYLSNYNAYQSALQNQKQTNSESEVSVLNIEAKELAIKQRENALLDAKQALADYSVFAPFAGTVSSVPVQKGEPVSSGTVLATLITQKQLAEISMNEVDVAKIKLEQKATLTFDAVPDLSITGLVQEIDSVGTISAGVVTYNVKISFDTEDDRVKPGMSVSASIITNVKQDVLIVPNSAVKSQNGASYVEMFDMPLPAPTNGLLGSISKVAPNQVPVEVGLSNDSQTEIISGIKEGDEIVTRTILPTSAKPVASAPSLFGSTGGQRGGGNAGGARLPTGR